MTLEMKTRSFSGLDVAVAICKFAALVIPIWVLLCPSCRGFSLGHTIIALMGLGYGFWQVLTLTPVVKRRPKLALYVQPLAMIGLLLSLALAMFLFLVGAQKPCGLCQLFWATQVVVFCDYVLKQENREQNLWTGLVAVLVVAFCAYALYPELNLQARRMIAQSFLMEDLPYGLPVGSTVPKTIPATKVPRNGWILLWTNCSACGQGSLTEALTSLQQKQADYLVVSYGPNELVTKLVPAQRLLIRPDILKEFGLAPDDPPGVAQILNDRIAACQLASSYGDKK